MARYIITCEHEAEECEAIEREMQTEGVPPVIKGKEFFCSCPYGHHGGWVAVDGESGEAILASLPPIFRAHAKVHQIESMTFE